MILRYVWDARAAQYRATNGQFVSRRELVATLDAAVNAEARAMLGAYNQLRSGAISLDTWHLGMRQSIKLIHLWAAAAAKGGWAALDAADYGRVGNTVLFHYRRLQAFALQISSGLPLDGRAAWRVEMYGRAARQTFHAIELNVTRLAGYRYERNVVNPASENCTECRNLAELGVQPIGSLPRPGYRLCRTGCSCYLEFFRTLD